MEKKIKLYKSIAEDWNNSFKLQCYKSLSLSPIVPAVLALSTLAEDIPTGYYIGKLQLSIFEMPLIDSELTLNGLITKSKHSMAASFISCKADVCCNTKQLLSITLKLVRPNSKISERSNQSYEQVAEWRSINAKEIQTFASLSGDLNEIHTMSRPVVQGMLLLMYIEDFLKAADRNIKSLEMKFHKPIIADEAIQLKWLDQTTLLLLTNQKSAISLKILEESK